MNQNIKEAEEKISNILHSDISIIRKNNKLSIIEVPFFFPDGNQYQIYLLETSEGYRVTDMGHTFMHISYKHDLESYFKEEKLTILNSILSETLVNEKDGELYINIEIKELATAVFAIVQAITKIFDIKYLSTFKSNSTFYDDLRRQLFQLISNDKVIENYVFNGIENGKDFPIDFKIDGKEIPLYLFGVPNKDKARISAVVLERMLKVKAEFDSIIVFENQQNIPAAEVARLSNVGGELVSSLDHGEDFKRKLLKKAA